MRKPACAGIRVDPPAAVTRWGSIVLAGVFSAAMLAACSSSTSGNASTAKTSSTTAPAANPGTTTSSAATTTAASGSGSRCSGLRAGQGGIIQVFCNGTGDAKITIGAASKELMGGTCVEQSGQFAINFGAVAGPEFPPGKTKPDYLGALIADGGGALEAFTVRINGTSSGVIVNRTATVSADKKSATLHGKTLSGGASVTVAVTC